MADPSSNSQRGRAPRDAMAHATSVAEVCLQIHAAAVCGYEPPHRLWAALLPLRGGLRLRLLTVPAEGRLLWCGTAGRSTSSLLLLLLLGLVLLMAGWGLRVQPGPALVPSVYVVQPSHGHFRPPRIAEPRRGRSG